MAYHNGCNGSISFGVLSPRSGSDGEDESFGSALTLDSPEVSQHSNSSSNSSQDRSLDGEEEEDGDSSVSSVEKLGTSPPKNQSPSSMTTNQLKFIRHNIMDMLFKNDSSVGFRSAVDPDKLHVTNYYNYIRHPMDLSVIRSRLRLDYYKTSSECIADFQLMFNNCHFYNTPLSDAVLAAKNLQLAFLRRLCEMPAEERIIGANESIEAAMTPSFDTWSSNSAKAQADGSPGNTSGVRKTESIDRPVRSARVKRPRYSDVLKCTSSSESNSSDSESGSATDTIIIKYLKQAQMSRERHKELISKQMNLVKQQLALLNQDDEAEAELLEAIKGKAPKKRQRKGGKATASRNRNPRTKNPGVKGQASKKKKEKFGPKTPNTSIVYISSSSSSSSSESESEPEEKAPPVAKAEKEEKVNHNGSTAVKNAARSLTIEEINRLAKLIATLGDEEVIHVVEIVGQHLQGENADDAEEEFLVVLPRLPAEVQLNIKHFVEQAAQKAANTSPTRTGDCALVPSKVSSGITLEESSSEQKEVPVRLSILELRPDASSPVASKPIVPRPVSLFSDDDEDELDYGEDDLDEEY